MGKLDKYTFCQWITKVIIVSNNCGMSKIMDQYWKFGDIINKSEKSRMLVENICQQHFPLVTINQKYIFSYPHQ